MTVMGLSPLAGTPAEPSMLKNIPRLETAHYARQPDPTRARTTSSKFWMRRRRSSTTSSSSAIWVGERDESPFESSNFSTSEPGESNSYKEVLENAEGRLIISPRLLIRKSLVRAQPGEPITPTISAALPRR